MDALIFNCIIQITSFEHTQDPLESGERDSFMTMTKHRLRVEVLWQT